jgi:hypothetical protein
MKEIKSLHEDSLDLTNYLIESTISRFEPKGDINQLKVDLHPKISNFIFNREKDILEQERFLTLIKISRTIPNNHTVLDIIKGLGYKLEMK